MDDNTRADTTPSPPQEAGAADEVLREILDLMGYGHLAVEFSDEGERIRLEIVGDEEGELIGQKGQILDALQFIVGRILHNQLGNSSRPLLIDNGGYRERRSEALVQLAERLGEKAERSGKTVAVNPMSAHDRRIIHMTLKENPGVTTRSEGEGDMRRILIIPTAR